MNEEYIKFLKDLAWDSLLYLLAGGAVIACIIGLIMLFAPQIFLRMNSALNKRYSMRKSTRFLEIPRHQEIGFYRYHKILGPLITAGALFSLYYILFVYDQNTLVHVFSKGYDPQVVDWLLEAMTIFLILGNVFVLIIGFLVTVRPSALKHFEEISNYWISTRSAYKSLDIDHQRADRFLTSHPRIVGGLVILGSAYVILNLGVVFVK